MESGKKFLGQLKELTLENALKKEFSDKDLEVKLREMFKDPAYIEFMNHSPCIVGVYSFRDTCYMFVSRHIENELGHKPEQLTGKENTETAMSVIYPEHGELWFFRAIPKIMEYYHAAGSREEAMKISYSICVQLLTPNNERKWFYTETDLLDATDDGTPLISIFYMSNIDAVKKDDLVYYSVRRKQPEGHEVLFSSSFPAEDPNAVLTKREIEILKLIGAGKTTQEIADTLSLSKHTVDTHRKNMLKKTSCGNITELMSVLMYKGLL